MPVSDYIRLVHRLKPSSREDVTSGGVEREKDLHQQIMDWCSHQWPKWKVIHARMDQNSTIAVGAHDFTIFAPGVRCFCIECKARNKKLDPEQQGWKLEMQMLGWEVHVVRSFEEFLEVVK